MSKGTGIHINSNFNEITQHFNDLFHQYKKDVYRYSFFLTQHKDEADDLFQETWLRVVRHWDKINHVRDKKAWVFTITANLFRDYLRKKKVRTLFSIEKNGEMSYGCEMDTGSETESFEIDMALKKTIDKLPERQRQVFLLKEVQGFKLTEIGEIMKIPTGTVKSLMFRAVTRLRKDLVDFQK